ncbi:MULTISPECIES: sigma-70 family RNA polymerase sigma factor [Thermomonosporaceae]|uniref:sigma-70 family RNA polymerase sigma factor n=1 Tax=Thermomonosporaceae TaxID=2012 RepID=UPI00255A925C|nr:MULTISPECIES: sigma-70 family RNA polymerase sigma factor [Thermomonosporaceae]MDL4772967.1 sigma-70 family RNA polymerase sigma factor [Actinomadura xylanilytica]
METMQPASEGYRASDRFRTRNEELFARRRPLQLKITDLRDRSGTGEAAAVREAALREAERQLDDLTYEIMTANFGLVRRYVAAFTSRSSEHSEDYESAGKVGLLWAIYSYDPAQGLFASWAFKPIQREVLRAVRDAEHPNLNLGDFEKRPAILAAERSLLEEADEGAPPAHAEIARRAGVAEAQVRRVLDAPRLDSLHASVSGKGDEMISLEERLVDPAQNLEEKVELRSQLRALVNQGLPSLDARELHVLTRRFGLNGEPGQSLRVIGEQLGLSREGVRQIQQKALAKLVEPVAGAI